jgi:hypothetical protein
LGLLHHLHITCILVGHALQETVHVKPVELPGLLLVTRGGLKKLPIRVEEAGEASYKSCTDLVRVKRNWAHQTDLVGTAAVSIYTAVCIYKYLIPFQII